MGNARSHRLRSAVLALLLSSAHAVAAQVDARRAFVAQVDSSAAASLRSFPAAGLSIIVVRGADTLIARGYGFSDRDAKRAATANTVYEIGSITKQFTAAAIMRLVERGQLSLDDDLTRYVPFPTQGHRVTIRNLLTHTSGIHNYTAKKEWRPHWADDLSPDSVVGFVKRDTFDFAPGTKQSYSNTGYMLLGMVIEKVTGHSYAAVLEDEFFKPLGLRRTHYCEQHSTDPGVAKGYSVKDVGFVPADYLSMTHPFAAGAICSTVSDLARWESLFHHGQVVTPASYTQMIARTTLADGRKVNYGFGLSLVNMGFEDGRHPSIMHNGGINGFLSIQMYLPADSLIVVVLENTDKTDPSPFALDAAAAALRMKAPTPKSTPR